MDAPSKNSDAEARPGLILETWCYRDVFKQQLNQELLRQRQTSSSDLPEGVQSGVQHLPNSHSSEPEGLSSVAMMQRVLQNTEDEVQRRMDSYLGILRKQNPHRVKLMEDFPRPANMPDKIFMEKLWEEFRASEKSLCEEHLGPNIANQEGGYRMAFKSLQKIYGMHQIDSLLKANVKSRWEKFLSRDSSTGPVIFKPLPTALGSRKINTIRPSTTPSAAIDNTRKRSAPSGTFGGSKKARTEAPQLPILAPRHLPNLAEQNHQARVTIQKPFRQSMLRKEIRYNESNEDIVEKSQNLGDQIVEILEVLFDKKNNIIEATFH